MSKELLYASVGGESTKRKYEESPSPVTRRATGFSSAPDSAGPPLAYNNVPPPMNDIELAKQKAQEIAARLLNSADPLKRARVDNGGLGGGAYDSSDYGSQKPLDFSLSGPPQVASSGYSSPNKRIEIPNGRVGVIIGKGGETIKYLQLQSGAKIQVTRDMDADPNSTTRGVDLTGTPDQIAKAEQLINDVLSEAEAGGSGIVARRVSGQPSGAEQFVMKIPNNKVGLVIGKGGETIKNMQASTGARIQVIPLHLPPGDMSKERTVQIDGTSEQIEAAKQLVDEVISENRARNSSMSGGYSQQGYQTHPPPNWGQPGQPMQQTGYGYTQPGAYPGGPSPQYNMNQAPYSGYPTQPTSGGYATGWDQSTAAPPNQQAAQGGGYDYYNQQQQAHGGSGAPTDSSGYGYGQGQSYGQDGYGAYHAGAAQSGYGQPQTNTSAGYDQGYNSTYGTASNPTADSEGTASGQSYNAPQALTQTGYGAPSSQSAYGTQTPTGYGGYPPQQAQKPPTGPPAYAQPQQSPSAQGGGYNQPGYPPAYGAPSATQASHGQYSSAYSGGYSQPPAHSSDATPPTQPSGAAKASPPS